MKIMTFCRFRRLTGGFLALALFVTLLTPPAAYAADGDSQDAAESLTSAELSDMSLADTAVTGLTSSDAFAAMPLDERLAAADEQLQALAGESLIEGDSIYYDEENQMLTFTYACGVLGGILLKDLDDLEPVNGLAAGAATDTSLAADLDALAENVLLGAPFGTADIYYAFDNTVNSSRYPYYAAMQQSWSQAGLTTRMHTNLTVSKMKQLTNSDLCILSMHGSYYTYTYGRLWRRTITAPILILLEEAAWYKDLYYTADLLSHRVIKVNGLYCLLPSFFLHAYRSRQLEGTILFSETCDFFGYACDDYTLASAFLSAGARAVIGFRNTVYATYSRNIMWDTINQLIYGYNVGQALNHAIALYGADDVIWYSSLSTKRPHALAAYPAYVGNEAATLYR